MRGRKESGSWDDSEEGGRASEEKEREREVVKRRMERKEGER